MSNRQGINSDRYAVWRNDNQIGFVHLAFRVIITALNDFFYGNVDEVHSAAVFFENEGNSTLDYWCSILGMDATPFVEIIENYYRTGEIPSEEMMKSIDSLYNLMTIDYKH